MSERLIDPAFIAAHTQGYEELATLAGDYPPEHVAALCGIPLNNCTPAPAGWAKLRLFCRYGAWG